MLKFVILFSVLVSRPIDTCLRTGGGDDTGVPIACQQCAASDVTLVAGDDVETITPTRTTPTTNGDGCLEMTVTCDVSDRENAYTFMEFQDSISGPTTERVPTIDANLVCSNGAWTFTQDGVTTEITEVNCAVGEETPCTECVAGDITLTPGEVTPTLSPITEDADGCSNIVTTCAASPLGGQVFMQFNGVIGGPLSAGNEPVTATLVCNNGNWEFTQAGVTTVITEVNCIAA